MIEFLNSVIPEIGSEQVIVEIAVTALILVIGHLLVKTITLTTKRILKYLSEDETKKQVKNRQDKIKYISYFLDATVIITALIYLNATITNEIYSQIRDLLPDLISISLIGLLGVIIINLVTKFSKDFLKTIGIKSYFRELGITQQGFDIISLLIKGALYLTLLQILLSELGIGNSFISDLMTASSWAAAFTIAALLVYGYKDLFHNFAAGTYLKSSRIARPGEKVNIEGETGEIDNVSMFSTKVKTQDGYTMLTPNKKLMDSLIKFKRTQSDLETLDQIKEFFVAQHPSFCGPASMEMALEIFGYRHSQDEIGELAGVNEEKGAQNPELMEAVEEATDNEVKTAFVEYDKISDLGDEYKAWFNDGALIASNFYKPKLFQNASKGHYVLSVGVEGDEILIIDPSGESGGVYYVEADELQEAMGEFGHKRGYIVVAPEGTTAHWRIKNDLIYAEKTYYDGLSKTLETRLRKIMRQGRILKNATPGQLDKYLDKWTEEDKVERLWKPGSNQ